MTTRLLTAALAAAAAAGCTGPPPAVVTGAVTLDGRPVKSGHVYFDPDPTKGNDGVQGVAEIADGRFDTAAPGGKPPAAGPVVVRVDVRGDPAQGVPPEMLMVRDHRTTADLKPGPNGLDIAIPKSARLPPPTSAVVAP